MGTVWKWSIKIKIMKNKSNIEMREFSKKEILDAWKDTKHSTGVYIHSPFCKEQCEYCTFKGTLFKSSEYKRYYSEYLPNLLDFYKEILSSDIIKHYEFGGGNPSLMTPTIMRNIFGRIPNFKEKYKTIEMHVADWSKEQLDVLAEYNFTNVVACVQTFDSDILKKQHRRRPKSIEDVYEKIQYANSLGLNTLSDLIYFNTENIETDMDRLLQDIQRLIDNDITEISIATLEDNDTSFFTKNSENIRFNKIVRETVYDYIKNNPDYIFENAEELIHSNVPEYVPVTPFRIHKDMNKIDTGKLFSFLPYLSELDSRTTQIAVGTNYNTLGIGSYNGHKYTFSKIEDKLEYIEVGDTYIPKWLLAYDKNDHPIKELVLEFYNELESTIGDPPDGIFFTFSTEVTNYNKHNRNKQVIRELIASVKWNERSIIIDEYINKLKKLFPTWNFS
jgi:hypothetical protein